MIKEKRKSLYLENPENPDKNKTDLYKNLWKRKIGTDERPLTFF